MDRQQRVGPVGDKAEMPGAEGIADPVVIEQVELHDAAEVDPVTAVAGGEIGEHGLARAVEGERGELHHIRPAAERDAVAVAFEREVERVIARAQIDAAVHAGGGIEDCVIALAGIDAGIGLAAEVRILDDDLVIAEAADDRAKVGVVEEGGQRRTAGECGGGGLIDHTSWWV